MGREVWMRAVQEGLPLLGPARGQVLPQAQEEPLQPSCLPSALGGPVFAVTSMFGSLES